MSKNRFLTFSPGQQFTLAIIFMVLALTAVVSMAKLLGFSWVFDGTAASMDGGIFPMKMGQIVQTVVAFLLPAAVLGFVFSPTPFAYLGINKVAKGKTFLLTFLLALSISPVIGLLSDINKLIAMPQWALDAEIQAAKITSLFLSVKTVSGLLLNLFIVAVLPAVSEELLFRGLFQRIFTNWTKNAHIAIWISAALFSAIHFQFQGFIPRLFLGGLFGYLFLFSGSLWVPIFAHFVNNAMAVLVFYLYQIGAITQNPETYEGDITSPWTILISFITLGLVLYSIRQYEQNRTAAS